MRDEVGFVGKVGIAMNTILRKVCDIDVSGRTS